MPLPLLALGGIAAGSAIAGGIANYLGNREQANAAERASRETNRLARRAQDLAISRSRMGAEGIVQAGEQGRTDLRNAYASGIGDLGFARNAALGSISRGYGQAGSMARGGLEQAQGYLGAGRDNSLSALYGGYGQAEGALQGMGYDFRDPSAAMMDPGMAFRQQQGEQAIERAASARGGRLGGAQLKALAEYNQGLASQEYGAAFQRQNTLDQQRAANQMQQATSLAGLYSSLGSQAAGMEQNYASQQAGYGMQGGLAQSALATAQADRMSGMQYGAGQDLANMQIGQGTSLANLGTTTAANRANTLLGGSAQSASLVPTMAQANAAGVPYAGAGWGAIGQSAGQIGSLAMLAGMYGGGGGMGAGAMPTTQGGLVAAAPWQR